ncbi:MAG: hypothetical protein PHR68_01370 [Candidatus Gracilibacteria bacterium]|nr:hypothetical protein [Candidatus Gracilibacteria bacterium]
MNYTSSRQKGPQKSIKDYILPIISVIFILVLFISVLSGGKNDTGNKVVNTSLVKLGLASDTTEAYLIGAKGSKDKIDSNIASISQGEKIQVKEGMINLELAGKMKMKLNKLGELTYNTDGSFKLESSDLWGEFEQEQKINLNYFEVTASAGSVINLSQNEVSSRVYVMKGFVTVKNLSGNTLNVSAGNTLSLMMDESNNPSLDLKSKLETISDYVKTDDWFIANNAAYYLDNIDTSTGSTTGSGNITGTGNTSTGITDTISNTTTGNYINIEFPKDEYVSETKTITIKGTIIDSSIVKIAFDYDKATIVDGAFEVKNFTLNNKTNDIVYRVYDKDDNLLKKGVITVYYTNATTQKNETSSTNKFGLENYSLNASDFKFISPTENPYTTTDDIVMIEGRVPTKIVAKVVVNGFALTKFTAYSTYWKYFANAATDNLKEGLNLYKVEYYGAEGKLLNSNVFTIIKKNKELTSNSETGSTTGSGTKQ